MFVNTDLWVEPLNAACSPPAPEGTQHGTNMGPSLLTSPAPDYYVGTWGTSVVLAEH
jgi:hypothetical protein